MTESKGPSTWASAKMLDLGPPPQILQHVPCPQGSQLAKGVDPLTRMAARPRPLHTPTQLSSAAGGFAVTTGSPPQHPFTPLLVKQDSAFPWREPAPPAPVLRPYVPGGAQPQGGAGSQWAQCTPQNTVPDPGMGLAQSESTAS